MGGIPPHNPVVLSCSFLSALQYVAILLRLYHPFRVARSCLGLYFRNRSSRHTFLVPDHFWLHTRLGSGLSQREFPRIHAICYSCQIRQREGPIDPQYTEECCVPS